MGKKARVVHYLNQFFGGLGGEDQANAPLQVKGGPVGPGLLLQRTLGEGGEIVATLVCGDNHFAENEDQAAEEAVHLMARFEPDVVVAGPAFNAGRYGLACGRICLAAQERLSVPAITAMHPENPAVDLYRERVYIAPTAASAVKMREAVPHLARLALKLAAGELLGSAAAEGYLPTGCRRNEFAARSGAERAVEMLLTRLRDQPFQTELRVEQYDRVPPAPPLADLPSATIALVTEAGIVPLGNPDRLEHVRATRWARHSIAGLRDLTGETHQAVHGGFDNTWANEDPDRVLPLDVLRQLEEEGVIGKLHDDYYVTVGNGGALDRMADFGRAIAAELGAAGVTAVVLPAT